MMTSNGLGALLEQVEGSRQEIVTLLQDLVRIPTVNTGVMPTGNETALCHYLQDYLAREGIASDILESAPRRGNLVATLSGASEGPSLMFMAHTDVVPIEDESKWRYPPFGGEVHEGRLYGRGSSDCKGLLASQAMAMILLKRAGIPLRGDLILCANGDEETGGAYGLGWLAAYHPERVSATWAVNEGGGAPLHLPDGRLLYMLPVGEKGRLEVKLTVRGESCHAAMAWRGENVTFKLAEALKRLESYAPQIDLSLGLFEQLPELFGLEELVTAENVDEIAATLEAQIGPRASALRGLSRMTLVPTMIHAGVKSNNVPETATIICDVRTLPHQDEAFVGAEIARTLGDLEGVEIEIDYTAKPNASSYETPFAEGIRAATAQVLERDDLIWMPGLTIGFTDSRFLRPLGTVVYNFAPGNPAPNQPPSMAHGTDESIDIESLIIGTKMMLAIAWQMLVDETKGAA